MLFFSLITRWCQNFGTILKNSLVSYGLINFVKHDVRASLYENNVRHKNFHKMIVASMSHRMRSFLYYYTNRGVLCPLRIEQLNSLQIKIKGRSYLIHSFHLLIKITHRVCYHVSDCITLLLSGLSSTVISSISNITWKSNWYKQICNSNVISQIYRLMNFEMIFVLNVIFEINTSLYTFSQNFKYIKAFSIIAFLIFYIMGLK